MSAPPLRVGFFAIGLDSYWPQFDGLETRLREFAASVVRRLERPGILIVDAGLVDNPAKAASAGERFRRECVDLVFLHVTTYALSSTVLPVVRRLGAPVIVLNIAPEAAIDYATFNALGDRGRMTGEWLAFCQACPVPEIANVFRRASIRFHQITGTADDAAVWAEAGEWIEAACVVNALERNRLGVMGHYYGGMLDVYSDLTLQCAALGGHIELLEVDELAALKAQVSRAEIRERTMHFRDTFDVQPDCEESEIERAAATSVALDHLVERHQLGSLAYYYQGTGNAANEDAISSIIPGASLLTARGIPVAGECEVKNAQAMKILDRFGVGGSFTEFYAADYRDDVVLMGHDGPGHIAIAVGRTKVRPLGVFHGKVGRGLSVEMSVKHGPVTLLSVAEAEGGTLKFVIAESESVAGPILEIGNTNSRYRFRQGVRQFMTDWNAQGPAHHCAVGVGHVAAKLEKLALLLKISAVRV